MVEANGGVPTLGRLESENAPTEPYATGMGNKTESEIQREERQSRQAAFEAEVLGRMEQTRERSNSAKRRAEAQLAAQEGFA